MILSRNQCVKCAEKIIEELFRQRENAELIQETNSEGIRKAFKAILAEDIASIIKQHFEEFYT